MRSLTWLHVQTRQFLIKACQDRHKTVFQLLWPIIAVTFHRAAPGLILSLSILGSWAMSQCSPLPVGALADYSLSADTSFWVTHCTSTGLRCDKWRWGHRGIGFQTSESARGGKIIIWKHGARHAPSLDDKDFCSSPSSKAMTTTQ